MVVDDDHLGVITLQPSWRSYARRHSNRSGNARSTRNTREPWRGGACRTTRYGAEPSTRICHVDIAAGALPLSRSAIFTVVVVARDMQAHADRLARLWPIACIRAGKNASPSTRSRPVPYVAQPACIASTQPPILLVCPSAGHPASGESTGRISLAQPREHQSVSTMVTPPRCGQQAEQKDETAGWPELEPGRIIAWKAACAARAGHALLPAESGLLLDEKTRRWCRSHEHEEPVSGYGPRC